MDGWTDGRMVGRKDGWKEGWLDESEERDAREVIRNFELKFVHMGH